jgi:hypothetical protein
MAKTTLTLSQLLFYVLQETDWAPIIIPFSTSAAYWGPDRNTHDIVLDP